MHIYTITLKDNSVLNIVAIVAMLCWQLLAQVNGMVYLSQEWNFGTPTDFPSPATPPSPPHSGTRKNFMIKWQSYRNRTGKRFYVEI